MKVLKLLICMLILAMSFISCTNTRWTVKDKNAVDPNDYEVLSSKEFLSQVGKVSSGNPVLKLQLLTRTTYKYTEKVLVQRTIQKYRLRPGFVALGLAGAAITFFAANTGEQTRTKSLTLNAAGGLMAALGFINMKPSGKPQSTDEERYLRKTGTKILTDTLEVHKDSTEPASIQIKYGNQVISEDSTRKLDSGLLEIDLSSSFSSLNISGLDTNPVSIAISYLDSSYHFSYPLKTILQPFAQITAPVTELRNVPEQESDNILAELGAGSQLQITGSQEGWYKVLYGISENYISKEAAVLTWHPSEFADEGKVITIPQIPYGNIDVENNIPILSGINPDGVGIIVTNENYHNHFSPRTYANRDGKLIESYLENSMGFEHDNIFRIEDETSARHLLRQVDLVDSLSTDSTHLIIFLSGHGTVSLKEKHFQFNFELDNLQEDSTSNSDKAVDLASLFRHITSIPSTQTLVISDIDFKFDDPDSLLTDQRLSLEQPLQRLAGIITNQNVNATVLYGSRLNQHSGVYLNQGNTREDKKHRIFPYFFVKALQKRLTGLAEIYQYLERNVSYTSRRLHDEPQDPRIYGRISLNLIPLKE